MRGLATNNCERMFKIYVALVANSMAGASVTSDVLEGLRFTYKLPLYVNKLLANTLSKKVSNYPFLHRYGELQIFSIPKDICESFLP